MDKVLKSYIHCDWSDANPTTSGSPQVFVTSLYRSVESELDNLGLFDSTTPQGGGVPIMQESHWTDVRAHIESLVFNTIYEVSWALGPPPGVYALTPGGGATGGVREENGGLSGVPGGVGTGRGGGFDTHRDHVTLQKKFAYLNFLSLQHMGLELPTNGTPSVYFPYLHDISKGPTQHATHLPEEWRLALKELSMACEMRTPLKIMQKLKSAISMGTHALEGIMSHPGYYQRPGTSSNSSSGTTVRVSTDDEGGGDSCSSGMAEQLGIESLRHLLGEDSLSMTNTRYRLQRRALHRKKICPTSSAMLGADELMPLLSWMIIQANPPHIDRAIWLCAEFRHHTLQMGEYAYALTQVSSALEYVKEVSWDSLVISEKEYFDGIGMYDCTLELLNACKKGDSSAVRDLLARIVCGPTGGTTGTAVGKGMEGMERREVNINGRTPNQSDSPLSISIKHRHTQIVHILLSHPNIDINGRISPYHTPSTHGSTSGGSRSDTNNITESKQLKDYTPLMLASFIGECS